MDNDKFEVLKLLATIADKESDRFWTRYRIMYYASTGLVAIAAWVLKENEELTRLGFEFFREAVASLGIAFAVAWLISIRLGRYYERRLFENYKAVIDADKFLTDFVRFRSKEKSSPESPRLPNITYLYGVIPICFLIFWAYVFSKVSEFDASIPIRLVVVLAVVVLPIGWFIHAAWADKHPD